MISLEFCDILRVYTRYTLRYTGATSNVYGTKQRQQQQQQQQQRQAAASSSKQSVGAFSARVVFWHRIAGVIDSPEPDIACRRSTYDTRVVAGRIMT